MKSIFEDFYYKELGCRENQPNDEEYLKRQEEYNEAYGALEETLDETQKKLLDRLFLCGAGIADILEYLGYKEGFRVALLLAFKMMGQPS